MRTKNTPIYGILGGKILCTQFHQQENIPNEMRNAILKRILNYFTMKFIRSESSGRGIRSTEMRKLEISIFSLIQLCIFGNSVRITPTSENALRPCVQPKPWNNQLGKQVSKYISNYIPGKLEFVDSPTYIQNTYFYITCDVLYCLQRASNSMKLF